MARAGWSTTVRGGKKLAALAARARRAQAQPVEIEVGVFASARYPSGISAAFIGAIHEFGAPNNKLFGRPAPIPERPWMRSALPRIYRETEQIIRRNLDPRNPILSRRVAELIGANAVGALQESITELSTPPHSETTIRIRQAQGKRGPHTVLVDTGFLRAAVTYRVNT